MTFLVQKDAWVVSGTSLILKIECFYTKIFRGNCQYEQCHFSTVQFTCWKFAEYRSPRIMSFGQEHYHLEMVMRIAQCLHFMIHACM